jgi:hypothetical protein
VQKKIEAWSQKCNKLMKEQEALNGKCKILIKERETWKHAYTEMAKGVALVLDVIGADFTEAEVEAPKIGLVEKSQKAWDGSNNGRRTSRSMWMHMYLAWYVPTTPC